MILSTSLPDRLSPLAALVGLIEGTRIADHPLDLAMQLDSNIVSARHLEYLSRRVARAIITPNSRLIVSMPPRHGKSETISHWACVWALARDPRCRILLASYEADFAMTWSRKVRDTIRKNQEVLGVRIKTDSRSAARWETTVGGGMVSAGAGGPLTGRGGDVIIIDDPIKNAEDAGSLAKRESVWDWWNTTVKTRMEKDSSVCVIMTRWSEDDLVGKLIAEDDDRWEVINFPALAMENDILGRAVGEPLWPERYDLEALAEHQQSESTWLSLYQQTPTPISHDALAFPMEVLNAHEARWCSKPRGVGNFERIEGSVVFSSGVGLWSVWVPPKPDRSYIIGADPCGDGQGRDFAHAVVIDAASGEQCACLHGRIPPSNFAKELIKAGYLYRSANGQPALIAPEANGEGSAAITILRDRNYPAIWRRQKFDTRQRDTDSDRVGWHTNKQTKPLAVSALADGLVQNDLIVHDIKAIAEMKRFAKQANGTFSASRGNDDRVLAWGIAAAVRKYGSNLPRGTQEHLGSYRTPVDSVTGY